MLENAKWFQIFRTGKHIDSKGNTREWTRADLDKTVSLYNPEHHESPMVIGHPKTNGPAWGWAEKIKREDNKLLVLPRQVDSAFKEAVNAGRYKKRSVSFYPDGSLRHIGFLGAKPPAIKGLEDFTFDEGEEFWEYEENFNDTPDGEGGAKMPKTVEELEKALADERAAKETAEKKVAEFKEKADKATADFAESERTRIKKEISDFVEKGISDSKILPAAKEQGMVEFMEVLAGMESPAEIEFAEGDNKANVHPFEWFKKFVTSFGEHPLFKEMTKPKDEQTGQDSEFAEADKEGAAIAATVPSAGKPE